MGDPFVDFVLCTNGLAPIRAYPGFEETNGQGSMNIIFRIPLLLILQLVLAFFLNETIILNHLLIPQKGRKTSRDGSDWDVKSARRRE